MRRSFVILAGSLLLLGACATTPSARPETGASASATAGSVALSEAVFVASLKTKRFYPVGCAAARLIAAQDAVGFPSASAAEKAGFRRDGDFC